MAGSGERGEGVASQEPSGSVGLLVKQLEWKQGRNVGLKSGVIIVFCTCLFGH